MEILRERAYMSSDLQKMSQSSRIITEVKINVNVKQQVIECIVTKPPARYGKDQTMASSTLCQIINNKINIIININNINK